MSNLRYKRRCNCGKAIQPLKTNWECDSCGRKYLAHYPEEDLFDTPEGAKSS